MTHELCRAARFLQRVGKEVRRSFRASLRSWCCSAVSQCSERPSMFGVWFNRTTASWSAHSGRLVHGISNSRSARCASNGCAQRMQMGHGFVGRLAVLRDLQQRIDIALRDRRGAVRWRMQPPADACQLLDEDAEGVAEFERCAPGRCAARLPPPARCRQAILCTSAHSAPARRRFRRRHSRARSDVRRGCRYRRRKCILAPADADRRWHTNCRNGHDAAPSFPVSRAFLQVGRAHRAFPANQNRAPRSRSGNRDRYWSARSGARRQATGVS